MSPPTRPGAKTALALLLAINLFNYLDRQILSAVLPRVEAELHITKDQAGWLSAAFLIAYTVVAPLFGWLGDRMSRWLLVGLGVIVWSLASGGTGLAAGFLVMFLTRAVIGVGEGAYGPVAPSLISDLFPVERRGQMISWFYVAIPVGSALGYILGGVMAESSLGWRWAFFAVVPPGVMLGVLCFFMREPPRGESEGAVAPTADGPAPSAATSSPATASPSESGSTAQTARWEDYAVLGRIPSYVLNCLGMTALTFVIGGVAVWMPSFLYEREAVYAILPRSVEAMTRGGDPVPDAVLVKLVPLAEQSFHGLDEFRRRLSMVLEPDELARYRIRITAASRVGAESMSLDRINLIFGLIICASGLVATLAGGWLGDRLRNTVPGSYFVVSGAAMVLAFPSFILAIELPLPYGWIFIFTSVFLLFFNTGPTNTILANVTPPAIRSSAFALNIFVIHLLGDVSSPILVGWLGEVHSLRAGMFMMSAMILVGGMVWLWGAKYLDRDTELAATRLTGRM